MGMPFSIVDVGEAAAVVLLRRPEPDALMREVAAFLRVPVTAVAWPEAGGFRVRLFGPAAELEFSGTGLAAVAHAVWQAELVPPAPALRLLGPAGDLEARRLGARLEVAQEGRAVFSAGQPRTVVRG